MSQPPIPYTAMVAHFEAQAALNLEIAAGIKKMIAGTPVPILLPAEVAAAPSIPDPGQPETAKRHGKRQTESVGSTILRALAHGPLSARDLAVAVVGLRPGTPTREVSKQCWTERQRNRIHKGTDGLWRLGQAEELDETAQAFEAANPVPAREDSLRETIRQCASEPEARTISMLAERVREIRPNTIATHIRTQIKQLITAGEFHYDPEDNWGVRPYRDGEIVFPKIDLNRVPVTSAMYSMAKNGKQAHG